VSSGQHISSNGTAADVALALRNQPSYALSLLAELYAVRASPLWKDPEATALLRRAIARAAPLLEDKSNEDVKIGEELFSKGPFPAGHAPAGVIRAAFISGESALPLPLSHTYSKLKSTPFGARRTIGAAIPPACGSLRHLLLVRPSSANRPAHDLLRRFLLCTPARHGRRPSSSTESELAGRRSSGGERRHGRRDAGRPDAVARHGRRRSASRVE
jgi:hypothetical protein